MFGSATRAENKRLIVKKTGFLPALMTGALRRARFFIGSVEAPVIPGCLYQFDKISVLYRRKWQQRASVIQDQYH